MKIRTDKIADIKLIRRLTQLLGKCGIKSCYHNWEETEYLYDENHIRVGQKTLYKVSYGWGLKVTKDYVESKYEYERPKD